MADPRLTDVFTTDQIVAVASVGYSAGRLLGLDEAAAMKLALQGVLPGIIAGVLRAAGQALEIFSESEGHPPLEFTDAVDSLEDFAKRELAGVGAAS